MQETGVSGKASNHTSPFHRNPFDVGVTRLKRREGKERKETEKEEKKKARRSDPHRFFF